jgi:hypothetical protein
MIFDFFRKPRLSPATAQVHTDAVIPWRRKAEPWPDPPDLKYYAPKTSPREPLRPPPVDVGKLWLVSLPADKRLRAQRLLRAGYGDLRRAA